MSPANGFIALTSLAYVNKIKNGHRSEFTHTGKHTHRERKSEIPYENNMKVNYFRLDLNLQISAKRKEMYSLSLYSFSRLDWSVRVSSVNRELPLYWMDIGQANVLAHICCLFFLFIQFHFVYVQSEAKPSQTEYRSTETKLNLKWKKRHKLIFARTSICYTLKPADKANNMKNVLIKSVERKVHHLLQLDYM